MGLFILGHKIALGLFVFAYFIIEWNPFYRVCEWVCVRRSSASASSLVRVEWLGHLACNTRIITSVDSKYNPRRAIRMQKLEIGRHSDTVCLDLDASVYENGAAGLFIST
jgi:hypothetical protein